MASLQGKLLLASPALLDPNFVQSVVLLVQHDENGALGLVLNRTLRATLRQAWEQVDSDVTCAVDHPLYCGGPCDGPLMVLHMHAPSAQVMLPDGTCFSTEKQSVEWLVAHGGEQPAKFCVGYSGWSPDQLEAELESGSWVVAPATRDRIFRTGPETWEQVMRLTHPNVFLNPAARPGDPSWN